MNKKLTCMIVDDDPDDVFFHRREIEKNNLFEHIIVMNTAIEALAYLKSDKDPDKLSPDLIFLDINMPRMNGWEFLEEYNKLSKQLQGKAVLIMLSTSDNAHEKEKAKLWHFVSDFITKPLTQKIMEVIVDKYFQLAPGSVVH